MESASCYLHIHVPDLPVSRNTAIDDRVAKIYFSLIQQQSIFLRCFAGRLNSDKSLFTAIFTGYFACLGQQLQLRRGSEPKFFSIQQ